MYKTQSGREKPNHRKYTLHVCVLQRRFSECSKGAIAECEFKIHTLPHILLSVPIFVAVGGLIFIIHHLSNYVGLCLCLCLGHCFLPLSVCFDLTQVLEGGLGVNEFRAAEPESGASGGAGSSGKEREAGTGGRVQGGLSDQCQIHEVRVHCMMT